MSAIVQRGIRVNIEDTTANAFRLPYSDPVMPRDVIYIGSTGYSRYDCNKISAETIDTLNTFLNIPNGAPTISLK